MEFSILLEMNNPSAKPVNFILMKRVSITIHQWLIPNYLKCQPKLEVYLKSFEPTNAGPVLLRLLIYDQFHCNPIPRMNT